MEFFVLILSIIILASIALLIAGLIAPRFAIYGAMKKTRKNVLILYGLIFLGAAIVIAIITPDERKAPARAISNTSEQMKKQPDITMPAIQGKFMQIVNRYSELYVEAPNELKQSALKVKRDSEIKEILKKQKISEWVGMLDSMSTTGQGNAAITIKLPESNISINTINNEFSEALSEVKTLIPHNSELYETISNLKKGDKVKFSGYFVLDNKYSLETISATERGSMVDPNFIFKFTKLEPIELQP